MAMYIQLIGRMLALPQGAALTAPFSGFGPSTRITGWLATNGARCRFHADRPHARAATTVGDAEGLVQVQVRDVRADVRRSRQADLGVEVGAVHVDLAAVAVDHFADLAYPLFVHAVGRRIGDHQAGQPVARLGRLEAQVVEVDVAAGIALDDHHPHAGHDRRGRVGAVGRCWGSGRCRAGYRRGFRGSGGSPAGRHIRPARRSSAACRWRRSR